MTASSGPRARVGMTGLNVVFGSVLKVSSLVLTVLIPMVATRLLPRDQAAQVLIAISTATLVAVVAQAGLPWTISRRVSLVRVGRLPIDALGSDLLTASACLLGILVLLIAAVLPPWGIDPGWIVPEGSPLLATAILTAGIARAWSRVLSEANKGFGQVNSASVSADLAGPALGLVLVAILGLVVRSETSSTEIGWALALGWIGAVGIALRTIPVRIPLRVAAFAPRRLLREGALVLGIISILNVGIQQVHVIIAGYVLGLDEAAVFSTAARLASLTGAPLMIIAGIATPDIGTALQSRDENQIAVVQLRLQRLTGAFFVAGSALCLLFAVWGSSILGMLFGREYAAGHAMLVVLAIGPLGSLFAGVAGLALTLAGAQRRLLAITLVGSAVAVVSMVAGAFAFGGIGLSVGYSVGQLGINILLLRSSRKVLGFSPMANPIAATLWVLRGLAHRLARSTGGKA